tara:strand:+ start:49 stop:747 length:699 start_codon:yes stop_codon:yes gene_type:complete
MTKNKLPKYSHGAYNTLLEKLDRSINIVKSVSNETLADEHSKWVETDRKTTTIKAVISLISKAKTYDDDNQYRQYKYCGNLEFKNKSIKNIRKLVEVEPRLIKEIYEDAKRMFDYIKERECSSLKYEKLYRLTCENNEYNKMLLTLEKEYQKEEDSWNNLTEYASYPNDDYCPFYSDFSEQEQIEKKLNHDVKITNYYDNKNNIKENIIKNEVEISNIFCDGIQEKDIANTY